ncbi:MAG: MFS transporter [Halieaceae bacterium]|nr:MFS transporter [Halieaceae bacterium]
MANPNLDYKQIISITACWFLAQIGYYAQYQLLGPLMKQFGLTELEITVMMSQEITVFAVTYFLLAGPMSRISRVKVALVGILVLFLANAVSGFTESFEVLRGARLFAGLAGGMLSAAGTASAASSANPQRMFAIVTVCWGVLSAVQPIWMPYFTVPFGASGGYYLMAALALLLSPFCRWLVPPKPSELAPQSVDLESLSLLDRITERLGVRGAPHARFALIAMLGLFLYEVGQGAVMVFLEQFGLNTGMEAYRVGQVIGFGNIAALSGGAVAAWMGIRYGYLWPIVLGIAANGLFAGVLALVDEPISFAMSNFFWTASYNFLVPYMLGVMSEMDEKGRWAVAADAAWWFGSAPGAAVGGAAVAVGGYAMLSLVPIGTGLVCIVLMLITIRKFNLTRAQNVTVSLGH